MKIAVLAHIRHRIIEPFSGGMEAHSASLCQGLRAAGHDVTLFAAAGSQDDNLVAICDQPYEAVLPWSIYRGSPELRVYQTQSFDRAKQYIENGDFDVVHKQFASSRYYPMGCPAGRCMRPPRSMSHPLA